MKTKWQLKEDMGTGVIINVKESDIDNIDVLRGRILFEDVRTGGINRKIFEEALNEFIAKISID